MFSGSVSILEAAVRDSSYSLYSLFLLVSGQGTVVESYVFFIKQDLWFEFGQPDCIFVPDYAPVQAFS